MSATSMQTARSLSECVRVSLGERSYDIVIEAGALTAVAPHLTRRLTSRRGLVVTAQSMLTEYGQPLASHLTSAGFQVGVFVIPDGEQHKNVDRALGVIEAMVAAQLDRHSCVIALGGGVIGDLAGFAASIYMRGLAFVQIPTTLLAQVDASVGGKVAVNHPQAKNLLGAFYQPRLVLIDPLTLRTLPAREFRSGMAEVIKYGVVVDADLFTFVEEHLDAIMNREPDALTRTITRSCELKARIVERDDGTRALLNYGHTTGHAIEACDYGRYTHGEAVALGMTVAARLARRLGLVNNDFVSRQDALLQRVGLPLHWEDARVEEALAAMRLDKKTEDGKLRFVLPQRLGTADVVADVPVAQVRAALQEIAG